MKVYEFSYRSSVPERQTTAFIFLWLYIVDCSVKTLACVENSRDEQSKWPAYGPKEQFHHPLVLTSPVLVFSVLT